MKKHTFYFLFLMAFPLLGIAQKKAEQKNPLIQFSGVVVSSDSLQPIPYAAVTIHKSGRGTITDFYGFFPLLQRKATLSIFIISDTSQYYLLFQIL